MNDPDIRWIQRYKRFLLAFKKLEKAVELSRQRELNELEKLGMIHYFECTCELAWNVLKEYLENLGLRNIYGPKNATCETVKIGLIDDRDLWLNMINKRILISQTYDIEIAKSTVPSIVRDYYLGFNRFCEKFKTLSDAPAF
jgi:nucleotidyltransferase substrate binding protein (TIGR01987 family)